MVFITTKTNEKKIKLTVSLVPRLIARSPGVFKVNPTCQKAKLSGYSKL